MKVEQRIGRVDRIGQEHPEITIYHYVYENTVESDIYDVLGERIGMFEDVVGELQPILAGVSGSIKSATLEGKDASETSKSLSNEMEDAEGEDTVEVEDALTDVDVTETEEVLENARLEAWSSDRHPDIKAVGNDEHEDIPFTVEAVEAAFVEVIVKNIPDLEISTIADLDEPGVDIEEKFWESIYLLSLPEEISVNRSPEPGTVAHALSEDDRSVIITFDSACASEYPSVRFFLPGDHLFAKVIERSRETSELEFRWVQFGCNSSENRQDCVEGTDPFIVAAVQDDEKQRVRLGNDGRLTSVSQEKMRLQGWCEAFVNTRSQ